MQFGAWEEDEKSILDMTSEFDIDLILKKESTDILNIETKQVDVTSSDIYKE